MRNISVSPENRLFSAELQFGSVHNYSCKAHIYAKSTVENGCSCTFYSAALDA